MFLRIKFLMFIFGFFFSVVGNAQQYTEGVFEFGLISHEITKDSVDNAMVKPIIEQLKNIPKVIFYYTPDRLAVINEDPSGSITRGVIDLKTNKEYSFSEIAGVKSFIVNDFVPEFGRPISIHDEYGEGKQLKEKIFGLNCTEFNSTNGESSLTLITSKDLILPDSTMLNSMLTEEGFTISTKIVQSNVGLSYSIGMKSFSPEIKDRSVLSLDTTGMTNMTPIKEGFEEAIKENKN